MPDYSASAQTPRAGGPTLTPSGRGRGRHFLKSVYTVLPIMPMPCAYPANREMRAPQSKPMHGFRLPLLDAPATEVVEGRAIRRFFERQANAPGTLVKERLVKRVQGYQGARRQVILVNPHLPSRCVEPRP